MARRAVSDWARSPGLLCLGGWPSAGPASSGVFRRCRIRCQQSSRVHSGTSSRIRLIASRFLAGPCLIPAISNRSMAANCLLGLLPFGPGALGHCATSLQADRNRELASRDYAKCTGREQYSRSIQSEVGCGYQRGATFVVPHFFPWTKERLILSWAESEAESALSSARLPVQLRGRLAAALLSGDARSAVYCPTLTKGTSGRKKYQKKVIA